MTNAQKTILEHFDLGKDIVTICPFLVCDPKTDPHMFFSKDLWIQMCKDMIKHYGESSSNNSNGSTATNAIRKITLKGIGYKNE